MSDQKKEAKNKFISYPKVIRILRDNLSATPEELAAWIFFGSEAGGVSAYLDVDELDEPDKHQLFWFDPWNRQADNYLAQIAQCWFLAEEIECFRPEARFITGRALIDRWAELNSGTEAFIEKKIREYRLTDIHPITGGSLWNNDAPNDLDNPGTPYYPPRETALFELALVEKVEIEDGVLENNEPIPEQSATRLNHDKALQAHADELAASYYDEHGEAPKKAKVAMLIKSKINTQLDETTIKRRIRNTWKDQGNK